MSSEVNEHLTTVGGAAAAPAAGGDMASVSGSVRPLSQRVQCWRMVDTPTVPCRVLGEQKMGFPFIALVHIPRDLHAGQAGKRHADKSLPLCTLAATVPGLPLYCFFCCSPSSGTFPNEYEAPAKACFQSIVFTFGPEAGIAGGTTASKWTKLMFGAQLKTS